MAGEDHGLPRADVTREDDAARADLAARMATTPGGGGGTHERGRGACGVGTRTTARVTVGEALRGRAPRVGSTTTRLPRRDRLGARPRVDQVRVDRVDARRLEYAVRDRVALVFRGRAVRPDRVVHVRVERAAARGAVGAVVGALDDALPPEVLGGRRAARGRYLLSRLRRREEARHPHL